MSEPMGAGTHPALQELDDDFDSVLCVVAHPDDIEYGTAAAVAKWTDAGKRVTYFLLTRGEAGIDTLHPDEAARVREQEERDGAAVVGVTEVDFGNHRDGVVEYGLDLRRDIAREIRRRRPDVVVTGHYGDRFVQGMLNQADHRAVGLACVDAVADAGNRWIFPELVEDGLEPWNVKRLCFAGSPTATHYVDVGAQVDRAVASLEAHRAYNEALPEQFPKPAELIGMILGWGGQAAGVEKALTLDVVDRR
jgi:LmbE family N-acetylglucosaminyl deacetylase